MFCLTASLFTPDRRVNASAVDIDEDFFEAVEENITDLLDNEPERKFPSKTNCRFCKVVECDERWSDGDGDEEPQTLYRPFCNLSVSRRSGDGLLRCKPHQTAG